LRLLIDTGVFSATLAKHPRPELARLAARISGNQNLLAAQTVAELRYGSLLAQWGTPRRRRLEDAIASMTIVPVTDTLITKVAELRIACRAQGHPLADRIHANDLWIAAAAVHVGISLVSADQIFQDVPGLNLIA
jgi:tRNA(fMet)-specific endonuclease VapC